MTQAEVLAQWEARENDRREMLIYREGEPSALGKKLLLKQLKKEDDRLYRFPWYRGDEKQ